MTTQFTSNEYYDQIDSRDILERLEELQARINDAEVLDDDEQLEFDALRELAEECEGYSDWEYGEQLINVDYFTDYIAQIIEDCYDLPKVLTSGEWPYRHITIDFEAAAKEAEQDYTTVSFLGSDYLIRSY